MNDDVIERAKHVVTVALIDKIGHGHEQMGSDYWGLEAEAIVEALAAAGLLAVTPTSKPTQSEEATDA